jgi:hypothetical protein
VFAWLLPQFKMGAFGDSDVPQVTLL